MAAPTIVSATEYQSGSKNWSVTSLMRITLAAAPEFGNGRQDWMFPLVCVDRLVCAGWRHSAGGLGDIPLLGDQSELGEQLACLVPLDELRDHLG